MSPGLPPLPGLPSLGIAATRLGTGREVAVTDFCRACEEFFTLVAGESSAAERARLLVESRPPGVEPARKHLIGIERSGELVGIVELLEGFPRDAEWYVGLLLLVPAERTRGLGSTVWSATEAWIGAAGGRHVRLIVQEQNPGAARFWQSVGFTANGTVEQVLATRTNRCWRFEKPLAASSPLPAAERGQQVAEIIPDE